MGDSRRQRILQQHDPGHGAAAAGDRCDPAGLLRDRLKVHIAAKLAVLVPVHGNVNDSSAFLHHVRRNQVAAPHSGDENIRLTGDFPEIGGAGVADGDGSVAMEQQHGLRLAHNTGAAHHPAWP